jgi:hypothetical protein
MQDEHENVERSGAPRIEVTRGIIVILLAVAVGAFVVTQGLKDDDGETAAASDVAAVGPSAGDEAASEDGDGDGDGDGEADSADSIGGATAESGDDVAGTARNDVVGAEDPAADTDDALGGEVADPGMVGDDQGTTSSVTDQAGPATQDAADVTVLVLNGAGAKGTAGRGSTILKDAGYEVLAPRNANFLGPSKVFYTDGFEEAAAGVAAAFGTDPGAVVAPLDPGNLPINDTRGADIVVVVGEDGLIEV